MNKIDNETLKKIRKHVFTQLYVNLILNKIT
jgi:hypothetical protein